MLKEVTSLFLVLALIFSIAIPVSATEVENPTNSTAFDIKKVVESGNQEQIIVLDSGEKITVGIEFIPAPQPYDIETNRYDISDGEWKIYFYTGIGNFSYKIYISNKKITDAYEPWYLTVGVDCTGASLSYTSTRATMYCTFATPIWDLVTWSGYIYATIQGDELVISIL